MIPHFTVYTDNLPEGVAGQAHGPVILIRPQYRNDIGLYEHELTHVLQWYMTLMLHPILYVLFQKYRLWAEVQAYRKQMQFPNANGVLLPVERAAQFLAQPRYNLGITESDALNYLNQK